MNPLKLTFTANEQALTKTDNFTDFASNTVSYIEATFTLGENWTGYDSVRAVWKTDYYTISTVLDANFTCIVPSEVLRYKAKVFVNLVGSIVENDALTDRLTTFPVLALTVKANAAVNGTETAPVTPSQFEQFVDTVRDAAGSISDYSYDSEAWAVGKRGGVDVPSTDETYHNNSKYWAEQNAGLSDEVADLKSEIGNIDNKIVRLHAEQTSIDGDVISIKNAFGASATIESSQSVNVSQYGKNLLATPYDTSTPVTGHGISYEYNSGVIIANGTATGNDDFSIVRMNARRPIKKGTYTFSGCPQGGGDPTYYMVIGITGVGDFYDIGNGKTIVIQNDTTFYMYFRIKGGQTVSNLQIKPQIEVGSSRTEWEQYKTNTYNISGSGSEQAQLFSGVNTFISDSSITIKYYIERANSTTSSVVSVLDYGATGDGIVDDTDALQSALDASVNKILLLEKGTYLFSKTLKIHSGTIVIGNGNESVLKLADSFVLDAYAWRSGNAQYRYPMVAIDSDAKGCKLSNFTLIGQTSAFVDQNEDGICVRGSNHIVENVVVHDINHFPNVWPARNCLTPAYGICIINASNVIVNNVSVYNCGYEDVGTENSDRITITNSLFGDSNQTRVQIHKDSTNIVISNNKIYTGDYDKSESGGITLDADITTPIRNVRIVDNYVCKKINTVAGGEHGIFIIGNVIDGLIIQAAGGSSNRHYTDGLIITDNRLVGRMVLYADNLIVKDNIIDLSENYYMIYASSNKNIVNNNLAIGTTSDVMVDPH